MAEFKRNSLTQISPLVGFDDLLEPLRLAPSASNRQPWQITGDTTALRLNIKKDGFLSKRLFGAMRYSDAGIGLCHLWLATQHAGVFAGFTQETAPLDTPDGFDYFYSIQLVS
jgi:hypothetical protein